MIFNVENIYKVLRVRIEHGCREGIESCGAPLYYPRIELEGEARSALGVLRGELAARPVS